MKQHIARVLLVAITLAAACSDKSSPPTGPTTSSTTRDTTTSTTTGPQYSLTGARRSAFGLNGTASGFPKGIVFISGGGSYDPTTASNTAGAETDVHSNGGFSCVEGVEQGPINHCLTGEGVRWDTEQLLASAPFKCSATDAVKTAVTGPGRAVLQADFYRAGDGNDESFKAQMIVSDTDLADNIPGIQNVWVQGVGCGTANVNFN